MSALPDFANARVLVVGDVMLDRYWFGDVNRISPEAPVPVVLVRRVEERPGPVGGDGVRRVEPDPQRVGPQELVDGLEGVLRERRRRSPARPRRMTVPRERP